jgi:UDP-GlcNAc:undecaprenyl-phosphate GlcNAc-1-phosphate transferase
VFLSLPDVGPLEESHSFNALRSVWVARPRQTLSGGDDMTATNLIRSGLVALAVGFLLQPMVLRLMTAAAVLDTPSERSSHTTPTPRGGGVAIAVAVTVALGPDRWAWTILLPLLLFGTIGLIEDLRGVAIPARLVSQVLAGAATGLVLVRHEPSTAATVLLVLVTAVWLTAYANAFNFMDGINGISVAHAILAGTVYAALGGLYNLPLLAAGGTVVAAASLTFLPWNAGRARIFLGDVGAYGLGGLLGTLAAYGMLHGVPAEAAIAPLALYLADTGWTLTRRACRGETLYHPHRTHAYQRLTDVGWSHQRVTVATTTFSTVVCVCAITASLSGVVRRTTLDVLSIVILAVYLAAPSLLTTRLHRRPREERSIHV